MNDSHFLARLIASSPTGIIASDRQGNIIVFNKRAEEILGYPSDDVIGSPIMQLYFEPAEPRRIGRLLRTSNDGTFSNEETSLKGKDGQRIPVRLSATSLNDSNGNLMGSVGYFEDLRSVRTLEQRLEMLLRGSNIVAQAETLNEGLESLTEMMVSLLSCTFCLLLLVDETGVSLELKAVGFSPRSDRQLRWLPGKFTNLSEWPGHSDQNRKATVFRWSNERDQASLLQFSRQLGLKEHVQSLLSAPLRLGERMVGVLCAGDVREEGRSSFTEEKTQFALALAAQTSVFIDRLQGTERRIREFEQMRQAADALAEAARLGQVLDQIVHSAQELLRADSAVLLPYDSARGRFVRESAAEVGISAVDWKEHMCHDPQLNEVTRTVMAEGYIHVKSLDDREQYSFLSKATRSLMKRTGIVSFLGIALTAGEEFVGVLYVNYRRIRSFTEDDREVARAFANHAALALKKAKLLDQLGTARNAARVVAEVTALENLGSTLQSIVRGTQDVLRSDAVTLYTYDADQREFRAPPSTAGLAYRLEAFDFATTTENSVVRRVLEGHELRLAEDAAQDPFMSGPFVLREHIKSSAGIPLVAGDRKVGVMFVNYRTRHRFTEDEVFTIKLFANQAAVAIRNAQLFEQVERRALALQALYEAGRAVTSSLNVQEILNCIAEQTWQLFSRQGKQINLVDISLVEGTKAKLVAAYPLDSLARLHETIGEEFDLDADKHGPMRIITRALVTGNAQLVMDVTRDPDYTVLQEATRSQLVVLIKTNQTIIGAISVDHPMHNAFDEEDVRVLEALASQASIAIENARKYAELRKIKGLVGARTALAWMGMTSSIWRHAIEGQAITIREQSELLRKNLEQALTPDGISRIRDRVAMIERQAGRILEKQITPVLSAEQDVSSVEVNQLIRERTSGLWQVTPYKSVELELDLNDAEGVAVRASKEWLRRALDVLIDNGIEALSDCAVKRLSIASKLANQSVQVIVSDTGKGINEDVRAKLFNASIGKPLSSKGLGMGLLMAEAIVQTYGGEVRIGRTGPTGTSMIIELPLERYPQS